MWNVTETKQAAKELSKLPKRVVLIYQALTEDLRREATSAGLGCSTVEGTS